MNKNVSASFTLSVLVVGFFAVALYQPDTPIRTSAARSKPVADANAVKAQAVIKTVGQPAPSPQASPAKAQPEPRVTLTRSRDVGVSQVQVTGRVDPPASNPAARARIDPKRPSGVLPAAAKPEPRGAFTSVRAGETLADVARREYGTGANAAVHWTANPDLIERRDSPLRVGTMLRTP